MLPGGDGDCRGINFLVRGIHTGPRRGAGFRFQMEYGLDERYIALCVEGAGPSPLPSGRSDLRYALCLSRELRLAVLTRRSGARQGIAVAEDAG